MARVKHVMRFSRHLQCLIPHLLCDCPSYNCAATRVARCPRCFILSTFFCIVHPMCDRFTKDTFRLYATEDARREQFGSRGEMRQYKSPVQCTGVTRAGRRCGITSETSRLLDDRGHSVNEPLLLGSPLPIPPSALLHKAGWQRGLPSVLSRLRNERLGRARASHCGDWSVVRERSVLLYRRVPPGVHRTNTCARDLE